MNRRDPRGIGMTSQRARDRLAEQLQHMGIVAPEVLELIRNTPRHLFMDEALSHRAYENSAMPIGHGQTISQPYIVARMTEALLGKGPLDRILEIGAGSGYQTMILSQLAKQVYSVERIESLARALETRLAELGVHNCLVRYGDGMLGWPEAAPFDGILVAAAPLTVPPALKEQLKVGGRLVIPVGAQGEQRLLRITRDRGGYREELLDFVCFVPMLEGTI
jgi:protein-L-isoaspartate(D-aspartate) O-methyltransferase